MKQVSAVLYSLLLLCATTPCIGAEGDDATLQTQETQTPGTTVPTDQANEMLPDVPSESREWVRTSTASSLYFAYGSAELTDSATAWISRHALRLLANPRLFVTLVGYTDDFASSSYSIALGERRTQVVKDRLLALKVALSQVHTVSRGHEKSLAVPCQTELCRISYRRVEFVFGAGDQRG